MSIFDSPILLCDRCGEVVLRDTKWQECARAHHCGVAECPLKEEFLDHRPDRGTVDTSDHPMDPNGDIPIDV